MTVLSSPHVEKVDGSNCLAPRRTLRGPWPLRPNVTALGQGSVRRASGPTFGRAYTTKWNLEAQFPTSGPERSRQGGGRCACLREGRCRHASEE
jgi:hypothetical protein